MRRTLSTNDRADFSPSSRLAHLSELFSRKRVPSAWAFVERERAAEVQVERVERAFLDGFVLAHDRARDVQACGAAMGADSLRTCPCCPSPCCCWLLS